MEHVRIERQSEDDCRKIAPSLSRVMSQRLSLKVSFATVVALWLGGAIYCQVYCFVAFQTMNGMAMPLQLSLARSAMETAPAFAAFEASKRILIRGAGIRELAAVVMTLCVAAFATVILLWTVEPLFAGSSMPLRLIIADRMPGAALTVVAVAWAAANASSRDYKADQKQMDETALGLLVHHRIDWVHAAGNYVEVHSGGRVTLVRLSLHKAASLLAKEDFVQIHRSVLVNRRQIVALEPPHRPEFVTLLDGTSLKVGHTHRPKIFDQGFIPLSHSRGA
jgi:hypothetical protein